jgi:hypothetical protein
VGAEIIVGPTTLGSTENGAVSSTIVQKTRHPNFNGFTLANDMMLLRISRKSTWTELSLMKTFLSPQLSLRLDSTGYYDYSNHYKHRRNGSRRRRWPRSHGVWIYYRRSVFSFAHNVLGSSDLTIASFVPQPGFRTIFKRLRFIKTRMLSAKPSGRKFLLHCSFVPATTALP